ncbi:MAG TPA: hypothetical protein VHY20_10915, partial [Pirellulales bacterium]|nr:hypothetical protein [Pirellulales bacterium]
MLSLPRIALGTVQAEADVEFVSWALMELLSRSGCQVQHFAARSCLTPLPGAITATGLGSRHLDSWLMTPDVCRELLLRGTGESELALVEGRYDVGRPAGCGGGSLDQLCQWLDLPRLVVLDVRQLDGCQLPPRPKADGLLLDGIEDAADLSRWQTMLETFWGTPVLGALERLPRLRDVVRGLAPGSNMPREICEHLGTSLERYCKPAAIRRLAARREFGGVSSALFQPVLDSSPMTVAVAYDEAFHCYFPDTLDLLELWGASIIDFSPLHDESLPPETDLVYIGCGHPERYATELSDNHCMMMALRNH